MEEMAPYFAYAENEAIEMLLNVADSDAARREQIDTVNTIRSMRGRMSSVIAQGKRQTMRVA